VNSGVLVSYESAASLRGGIFTSRLRALNLPLYPAEKKHAHVVCRCYSVRSPVHAATLQITHCGLAPLLLLAKPVGSADAYER